MFGIIAQVVGGIVGKYQAGKAVKTKSAARIAEKEADLEVARLDAEVKRIGDNSSADADYDLQVLRNRDKSWIDEILICVFIGLFVLPFLDAVQATIYSGELIGLAEAVRQGWAAHGYEDGAPWWFEFVMVGIAVSTLGLFRLLRLWMGWMKKPKGISDG